MTGKEKLVSQFLARPTSLKYAEVRKVLLCFGFTEIAAKGSHRKFVHSLARRSLIIPVHNNDCKNYYKKLAYEILRNIK